MEKELIDKLVLNQKKYFNEGNTLDYKYRKSKLKNLKLIIKKYENEILEALRQDLGKSHFEGYMCEVGLVYDEINYLLKNLKGLARPKRVKTPLAQTLSKSFQIASPYGEVLIMSPWNYPFLLSFDPIVEAFSAGNTILFKPSRYSKNTNIVMKKILDEAFTNNELVTVLGGKEENEIVLSEPVDYIFFTGGKNVGKIVYDVAAKKMIPVTLELGGKSPCIVDSTANIRLAAKRIVFGKLLNAGQTCVAPDYIYVDESIKDKLIDEIKKQIILQYGNSPLENDSFGKIITERHFDRIMSYIKPENVYYGGKCDRKNLKIEPTILNASFDDQAMKEEIFGPIFPIVTFNKIDEVINYVNQNDSPLALYYFSNNKKSINRVLNSIKFGGGCVNDTIIHLATSYMSFGGVGASGIGSYHGKKGFETFTHYKSIVDKKNIIDLPLRYQPYKKIYGKIIRMVMK